MASNKLITLDFQSLFNVYVAGFNHGANEGPFPEHGTMAEFEKLLNGQRLLDGSTGYMLSRDIREVSGEELNAFREQFHKNVSR